MLTLGRGERPATMASLLHVDDERSLGAAMIARSGLPPVEWLRHYLDAYLHPLVHCFYVHDLGFLPHSENVILVLRDHVPQRVLMKGIAEQIVLMNATTVLPPERIRDPGDEDLNRRAIFTDVFDCFFAPSAPSSSQRTC